MSVPCIQNKISQENTKKDEEEKDSDDEDDENPKAKTQDMSQGTYSYEADSYTYTDATDGTVYIWDKEKKAWFPKVRLALKYSL